MDKLVIIGAGGFAKLVVDIVESSYKNTKKIIGFLDEDNKLVGKSIHQYPILGNLDWIKENDISDTMFVCAISDTKAKKRILNIPYIKSLNFDTIIHASATISPHAKISKDVIINAGAIIASDVTIYEHSFVNFDCTIGHDVVISEYVSVMPSVNIAGNALIHQGAYLGINATILQNTKIGSFSTVGASALVTKDVEDDTTVIGVPAKPME